MEVQNRRRPAPRQMSTLWLGRQCMRLQRAHQAGKQEGIRGTTMFVPFRMHACVASLATAVVGGILSRLHGAFFYLFSSVLGVGKYALFYSLLGSVSSGA
ncbi:hypothetical protein B0T22DRAFT_284895 [Podospora appendiculata]|uniref:Uncharacterized protein n=1 Tax=Podospora appendiculata TaxID=314037 RepID=A0AAE0X0V2_9PEZI|nr:hypothetical protein B0T22DRAFT_284895 [Podospora appendiculata]